MSTGSQTPAGAPLLLTGAGGFLGAWILRQATAAGHRVIACDLTVDRGRYDQVKDPKAGESEIVWQSLDVTDGEAVAALVDRHRPGAIIHLAALQIPDCARNPRLGAMVNVIGHLNLLEAERNAGGIPLVYSSSAAAKPRGPAAAPANLYGVYKKTDEEISRLYWQDHGVPSIGLRPYIVYGLGRDQGETSALTLAMRAAALDEPYELPFRGRFCLQYAEDVAEIFLRCATTPFEGALLSDISDQLVSADAVLAAIEACEPSARITVSAQQRSGPERFDIAPLEQLLGTLPHTPLPEGVAATIAAFRRADA